MRTKLWSFLLLLGLVTVMGKALTYAQVTDRIEADIPFDFYVGGNISPPEAMRFAEWPSNYMRGKSSTKTGKAALFF